MVSTFLEPIMAVDDKNLFYSNHDIKSRFDSENYKQSKIG